MRKLADLHAHAQATVSAYHRSLGKRELLGAPAAGSAVTTQWVRVLEYTDAFDATDNALTVATLTEEGAPAEDQFTVYAKSYGEGSGALGVENLSLCHPPVAPGDNVEIARTRVYVPDEGWVVDWFVCWPFFLSGCPGE